MIYTNKKGDVFSVEEDEYRNEFYVACSPKSKKVPGYSIDEVEPHEHKQQVENDLLVYANNSDLRANFLDVVSNKDFKYQGQVFPTKVALKLTEDEFIEVAREYIDQEKEVTTIELQNDADKKALKKSYDDKMGEKREVLSKLQQVVYSGCQEVEVDSSWERNLADGEMVLMDLDRESVIRTREMTPDEKLQNNLFDGDEGEEDNVSDETASD